MEKFVIKAVHSRLIVPSGQMLTVQTITKYTEHYSTLETKV